MSYTKNIPPSEVSKYSTSSDWNSFYTKAIAQIPSQKLPEIHLNVEHIIFQQSITFDTDIDCSVTFKDCYFKGDIIFYKAKFQNRIAFAQCYCDREMSVNRNVEFLDQFDIIEMRLKGQLLIRGGKFAECRWSVLDNGTIKISEGNFKELILGSWGGMHLDYFSLIANKVTGQVTIHDNKTKIDKLFVLGPSIGLSITVTGVEINNFTISNFKISDRLRIDKIKPITGQESSSIFAINESFLGNSEFNSLDFTLYNKLYIYESQLGECNWSNIKWKHDILVTKCSTVARSDDDVQWEAKINEFDSDILESYMRLRKLRKSEPVRDYYFRKREILRQLKYSSGKQGDVVNEQLFHGLEMIAHDKALAWEWQSISTKVIIKLSKYFSNFGQSFISPLIALLIGHLILLFCAIALGNFNDLTISICNASWEQFELATYRYFLFINPLREPDSSFLGYFIFFDIFIRIWASYMIYNIIRASRRFIK